MKVFDFEEERKKRSLERYKTMDMFKLMDEMTTFLEHNPSPIKDRKKLLQGIAIFDEVFKKCATIELRKIAIDYGRLYREGLEKV